MIGLIRRLFYYIIFMSCIFHGLFHFFSIWVFCYNLNIAGTHQMHEQNPHRTWRQINACDLLGDTLLGVPWRKRTYRINLYSKGNLWVNRCGAPWRDWEPGNCSVHEAGCLCSLNWMLNAWVFPGELLVFSRIGRVKKLEFISKDGNGNSNNNRIDALTN